MVKETKQRIVFIGAGNLATHLSMALQQAGYDVAQVYSRTEDSAQRLAGKLKCGMTTRIEELYNDADIYICEEALYLHTAGSIPMSVFSGKCRRYGVLYPLQTFSKNRDVQFDEIPIFIEGSSPETTATLQKIGREISGQVLEATSEQRRHLHLAAVFACNFTNHLYAIAAELLEKQHLPFDTLRPLIRETAAKIESLTPIDAQTGPAIRYDRNVMQRHIDDNDEKEIYRLLSRHIHAFADTPPTQSTTHE